MKEIIITALFMTLLTSGCLSDIEDTVCFNNDEKCFLVEIVSKPEDRARGLMERENLDPNRGMLFSFGEEGRYSFWMKNTKIPLDIIWINGDGEVVFIKRNAQPCPPEGECNSIDPTADAFYVLEVNAGAAENITVGDRVSIAVTF
ncbi:MAG: DUF192 domain-containing protein [Candidatus Aenigmatarchaeota archaeon]|nr:MAG: DUF192 domain-containing protein [Candidatus Aenigmarchaeota archaeon]